MLGSRERWVGQSSPAVRNGRKPPPSPRFPSEPACGCPRSPQSPQLPQPRPGPAAVEERARPPGPSCAPIGHGGGRGRGHVAGGGRLEPVGAAPPPPHPRRAAPGGGGGRGGEPGASCPQPRTKPEGAQSAAPLCSARLASTAGRVSRWRRGWSVRLSRICSCSVRSGR